MREKNILSRERKRKRLRISNLDDFKTALEKEGYKINKFDEEKCKKEVANLFYVDNKVIEGLYKSMEDDITYKANNIHDLIDYIEKIILFEDEHNELCKKISEIKTLIIDRMEYEREPLVQDNVDNIIDIIEKTESEISGLIDEIDNDKFKKLEKELDSEYLYAKDIELLKKMLIYKNECVNESYNSETRVKRIAIKVPEKITFEHITAKKGTIEYHEYLNDKIPRIGRLIRNLNKYITQEGQGVFKINQSETLQDSINIAVGLYNGKRFRAISGKNEIKDYCSSPPLEKAAFKSSKVNKLGKLGVGYNRVNDSEKKIFEEVHKQIEGKILKNKGNLTLYTKLKPCKSCYFVINQFMEKHPDIHVEVKYIKEYGEKGNMHY